MTTTALVGSTGLVGSNILTTLLSSPTVTSLHAFARRALPPNSASNLHPLTSSDTSAWPKLFPRDPAPAAFISALGTTRAAAGSQAQQYAIDHDLNLALAQAAKEAGVKVYVLISTGGASAQSSFFYPRMKGELEEAVQKLGFEHTVILRPGVIIGARNELRVAEKGVQTVARAVGSLSSWLKDGWAQDADVIAKAAVKATLDCAQGQREKGVWVLGQSDIVRLGRTEWKDL